MAKECIFCGERASTRGEHIWPKWAHPLLPDSIGHIRWVVKGRNLSPILSREKERRNQGPVRNTTIPRVCSDCNGGWMSKCETNLRPMLERLILGDPLPMGELERNALTEYLTYKLLVLDWLEGDPCMPIEVARDFHVNRTAPPNMTIHIFNCFEGGWRCAFRSRHIALSSLDDFDALTAPPNTKSFAFGYGNLFTFAYMSTEVDLNFRFDGTSAIRIFPNYAGPVAWPPFNPIDTAQAAWIAESLDRFEAENNVIKL